MKKRRQSRVGGRTLKLAVREMQEHAKALDMTVETWAKRAGVSQATVYALLAGDRPFTALDTVARMASAVHLEFIPVDAGSVKLRLTRGPKGRGRRVRETVIA